MSIVHKKIIHVQIRYRGVDTNQPLFKSTLKTKVNGYDFTRFLPPPKGSGFPPTTSERNLFMKILCPKNSITEYCLKKPPVGSRAA